MMVRAKGWVESGVNAYEIFEINTETMELIGVKVNPVYGYARKNGKKVALKLSNTNRVMNLQIEGRDRIGHTAWNSFYKGLNNADVVNYVKGC